MGGGGVVARFTYNTFLPYSSTNGGEGIWGRFGFLTAIGTTYTLIYNNPAKNLYGVPEEETNLGNSTLMELCNLN